MKSSFSIIEHPSDMGIEAHGASLKEAFENAAKGLMSIILDSAGIKAVKREYIQVHASDPEQLLVRWLNEILYCYDGQQFVPKEFTITEISDISLKAELHGDHFRPSVHHTRLDVKAITYHQLLIQKENGGFMVRVFVDI